MAIKTEQRLKKLEDMLKELKATYMISGGAMKLYESVSPTYSSAQSFEADIRFTPSYSTGQDIIVASLLYEFINSYGTPYNFTQYAYIKPQDNHNYLDFIVPVLEGAFKLKIISTVPGTFTRIS